MQSADSAEAAYPLFQEEEGGSTPTSALQLRVRECSSAMFREYNRKWHSRLPEPGAFYVHGMYFAAEHEGRCYAVAGWSEPIAPMLSHKGIFELRRFAISPDAPKNTASRVLSVMVRLVKAGKPQKIRLVSYQDTEVHTGGIYKAQGWHIGRIMPLGEKTFAGHIRPMKHVQSTAPKIRWELDIRRPDDTPQS